MNVPLFLRTSGALLMFFSSELAYCAEDNYMVRYACADAKFREQVPPPSVIDADQDLTTAAIKNVAGRIPRNLQAALREAANLSLTTAVMDAQGRIIPEAFYEHFLYHVGTELQRRFDMKACGQGLGDDPENVLEGTLYDLAINRYFSATLGKGEMYRWFVQHGGPYTYSAWVAAVVALELTGRSPDLESWKNFYERHTVKFKD